MKEIREKIDIIDSELTRLFCERMNLAGEVAQEKKRLNLSVLNEEREKEVLERVLEIADAEIKIYVKGLYENIFSLSRQYQEALNKKN
ncbi:MAG: chorismate mutase [Firmicutes bacterium]|nr:chorismate mutase [Bacillota bacterium]